MTELKTVLATNPLHPDGVALLEGKVRLVTAPDARFETLNRMAADAHGIIVRAQLPEDICEHGPLLEGLVRHGVGLDFIPVEAATRKGVAVVNLPGCNTQTVVEYVLAQLLNLRRPLVMVDGVLRRSGWDEARGLANAFAELGGSTLGIVGVGTIGSRIARVALALGMKVIGVSHPRDQVPAEVERVDIDELFKRADAIVLSCALTPETRGIASAVRIRSMKPTAVLVNASRGPVLDTAALVEALRDRRIAGAALDVYDAHPLPPSHPLFDCPNLLMTPHIAAITATSYRAMSVGACEEMLRILRGEAPKNLVNPDYRNHKATS